MILGRSHSTDNVDLSLVYSPLGLLLPIIIFSQWVRGSEQMGGEALGDGVEMSLWFRRPRFSQRLYLDTALLECFIYSGTGGVIFHLAFLSIYQVRNRFKLKLC